MTMFTRCPNCKSFDVRRSSVRALGAATKPKLRSPYRCRDCGARFWVVSKHAFYLAGVAGIAIVAGAAAWNVVGALDESRRGAKPTALDAASIAVLHLRSSEQVLEAQAESRRLSDVPTIQPAIAP